MSTLVLLNKYISCGFLKRAALRGLTLLTNYVVESSIKAKSHSVGSG